MSDKIKLMRPNVGEEALELVREVIDSGMLVEGKMVHEFEDTVKSYTGANYATACTSATTGLELALRALKVGPGDEVIVPDFTHPATALVVKTVGAEPVLVDVELSSYNTTADKMEEAISDKTKVIMP
ncbi:aminotransferase class I/II-fold pyridoxal phosphate-dependent enzyme, partial [Calditrichota bacterium]